MYINWLLVLRATDRLGNSESIEWQTHCCFWSCHGICWHENREYSQPYLLKVNLMHQPTGLWETEKNMQDVHERKIETECVFVRETDRVTAHRERTGLLLGWCGHMLIVACMETCDWVNLCAPDGARNREGGRGTYSWLGSRQAVQACGYTSDKPISTASVEMRLTEGAVGQNAGIQMCHTGWR